MAMRSLSKSPHRAHGLRIEMQSLRHALRQFKNCQYSVHTPSKLSRKDKLAGPRFSASLPHPGLLIWVRGARHQGSSWNSYDGALSMFALNEGGGGYNASMAGRDAPGFYCDCCGIWAVSAISQGAGVTSPCIFEPCENMASSWATSANTGYESYICSGCEPLLAVFPRVDAHARVEEQLLQQ